MHHIRDKRAESKPKGVACLLEGVSQIASGIKVRAFVCLSKTEPNTQEAV
jgi:hypothetical protein